MYMTRCVLFAVLFAATFLYIVYQGYYMVLLLLPCVSMGFQYVENRTVSQVVDEDIDTVVQSLRDEPASLVVGHNYGGGLVTLLLQHR